MVAYHCKEKPFRSLDASETNLMKSELPIEDITGRILVPQNFPINGEVGYPPFLYKYNRYKGYTNNTYLT